jgi:anti-sigma regulatory factor (Ser/Thr protein kinase)
MRWISKPGMGSLGFRLAVGFVACTAVGLFFSIQSHLINHELGRPVTWAFDVHLALVNWYMWGLLAVPVFGVAQRYPDHGPWWGRVAFHALCAAAVALLHTTLCASMHWLAVVVSGSAEEWSWMFRRMFVFFFHWDVLIYTAVLGFVHAINYNRKLRDHELHASQLETQLNRARLDALRMQLNPHFLFNSLNAISELVHENPMLADRVITQLATLLRAVLDESNKSEVTLKEELDFVKKYLEIEQVRLGERLTVRIEADPATLDWYVPSLILQPLIENAVRHGIARREGAGIIEVSASCREGKLNLQVRDSGCGVAEPYTGSQTQGVGLSNVRARLAHHYGEDFRLELGASEAGGYLARILIPARITHAEDAGADVEAR